MQRRSHLLWISLAVLAAVVPAPAHALHASDPCPANPGPLELACAPYYALGVSVGVLNGAGHELVFDYPLGQKTTLSELIWDLKSVAVAGVQASAGISRPLRLNLGFWWAINKGDGMMVDRDWVYEPSVSTQMNTSADNWTDESRHPDTTVDAGTMVDVNLTALALQSGPLSLHGILGLKSDYWHWSARGGTYVYSSNGIRDSSGSFDSDQEVISYKQRFTIPYVGLAANWRKPTFSVDVHALLSPFVSASSSDYHSLRDLQFEGDFFGGTFVGLGLEAAWAFATKWSVTLAGEYQSVSEITGDVTITGPSSQWVEQHAGGISMHSTMVTLGVGYRL